jgi:hypothetical protein
MNKELTITSQQAQELAAASHTGLYTFIHVEFLGEWRWGNEYQVVFMDSDNNYWAFEYKESVGDNYWSSIDESQVKSVNCYAVQPTQTIKYTKVDSHD